jgi:hypothetical protein
VCHAHIKDYFASFINPDTCQAVPMTVDQVCKGTTRVEDADAAAAEKAAAEAKAAADAAAAKLELLNPPESSRFPSSIWGSTPENYVAWCKTQPWCYDRMYDSSISSERDSASQPPQGWVAKSMNIGSEWLTIDAGSVRTIAGVAVQPRAAADNGHVFNHYVKSFKVLVSNNRDSGFTEVDGGKIFDGNDSGDPNQIVEVKFAKGVEARFVRIVPMSFNKEIVMRAGLLVPAGSSADTEMAAAQAAANINYIQFKYRGQKNSDANIVNGNCVSIGMFKTRWDTFAGCDADSCKLNDPSDLSLQTCDNNNDWQVWGMEDTGNGMLFHIKADPSRCMYISTKPENKNTYKIITLAACDKSDGRQLFKQESYAGSSIWRNVATSDALDSVSFGNGVGNNVLAGSGSNRAKKFDAIPA